MIGCCLPCKFCKNVIDKYLERVYALKTMNEELQKLGLELIESSRLTEEFSAQRGLINELFPYVYEASKRMSSRGISRWLKSSGVKLSAATIAKALRNPKPYWQELAEEFEPAAEIFNRAYGLAGSALNLDKATFEHFGSEPPTVEAVTREGAMDSLDEIGEAKGKLEDWFALPETVREACLAYVDVDLDEADVPGAKPAEGGVKKSQGATP